MALVIRHLSVAVSGNDIVAGLDVALSPGKIHAVMGPNGSGKSTLAFACIGHPQYTITGGSIELDGKDITEATPEARAVAGLFLSFQNPVEIPGVTVRNFLRTAFLALRGENALKDFEPRLAGAMEALGLDASFASRSINDGFSGGEKKRMEMVQLLLLCPKYAILDETDSGLDVDAVKLVGKAICKAQIQGCGILLITHYARLLAHVQLDVVHIMQRGRITQSGGAELAQTIERDGYAAKTPA